MDNDAKRTYFLHGGPDTILFKGIYKHKMKNNE